VEFGLYQATNLVAAVGTSSARVRIPSTVLKLQDIEMKMSTTVTKTVQEFGNLRGLCLYLAV